MSLWTSAEIAAATGGHANGNWTVTGVSIDTREIKTGELFVPLTDVRDGHDFIPMALEKGAAVLSARAISDVPSVKVDDALPALENLGRAACTRSGALRIGVTGSVGKTSVKEAIAAALGKGAHKSIKSYNNHWGVPLTMARMPAQSQFGVFEMGMNHAGEMSALSNLLAPQIAVITKIAAVHLEHFDGIADIAAAKAEIFDGMDAGGIAVLPKDDDFFEFLSERARAKGLTIIGVGADDVDPSLKLKNIGDHHALNGAFALAVAKLCKVPAAQARKRLASMPMLDGRGASFKVKFGGKSITVIDEAYNANPTSMAAAFAAAAQIKGRKIAVLGDMGELGITGPALHEGLAVPLLAAGFEKIITVGPLMKNLRGALLPTHKGPHCDNADGVMAALKTEIKNKDVVLLKASNSVGLGTVVKKLKEGTS